MSKIQPFTFTIFFSLISMASTIVHCLHTIFHPNIITTQHVQHSAVDTRQIMVNRLNQMGLGRSATWIYVHYVHASLQKALFVFVFVFVFVFMFVFVFTFVFVFAATTLRVQSAGAG